MEKTPPIHQNSTSNHLQISSVTSLATANTQLQQLNQRFSGQQTYSSNSHHSSSRSPSNVLQNNNNDHHHNHIAGGVTSVSSPLDLSSTPVSSKRLKLESPSPNQSIGSGSPPTIQQIRHNNTNHNNNSNNNNSSSSKSSGGSSQQMHQQSSAPQRKCHSQSDEINSWNVNQVCEFVSSIDICSEYVEVSDFIKLLFLVEYFLY